MKQTILGSSVSGYKAVLNKRILFCVIAGILALLLHIVLTLSLTPENLLLLLWCNIGCDAVCGFAVIYEIFEHILPCRRFYSLYTRPKQMTEETVSGISTVCLRYMDMDCYEVTTEQRRLFLPAHTIRLQEGARYTLSIVSNIIVEAEQ